MMLVVFFCLGRSIFLKTLNFSVEIAFALKSRSNKPKYLMLTHALPEDH